MKPSFTFVLTLVARAVECTVLKIPMPSLKDHVILQNLNIFYCLSTVNYRSYVRQRNGNIRKYSDVRVLHPNLNLKERNVSLNTIELQLYSKYNSTILLHEFFGDSIVSNKSRLTLSFDLSPSLFCCWEFYA